MDRVDRLHAVDVLPKLRRWENAPLPVDVMSGCLLPGPDYPLSFGWRPGDSPIEIHLAADWLSPPLAPGIGFILVDLLGVHAIAERLSWGYGNALIGEVGRRLQEHAGDGPTFRTGSDAFLLVMREIDRDGLSAQLSEIRTVVAAPVPYPGLSTTIGLTVTVGIAISKGGEDPADLFERAVAAANEAQQRGAAEFVEGS